MFLLKSMGASIAREDCHRARRLTNNPIRTLEQLPATFVRPPKLDLCIHIYKLRHLLQRMRDAVHFRRAHIR